LKRKNYGRVEKSERNMKLSLSGICVQTDKGDEFERYYSKERKTLMPNISGGVCMTDRYDRGRASFYNRNGSNEFTGGAMTDRGDYFKNENMDYVNPKKKPQRRMSNSGFMVREKQYKYHVEPVRRFPKKRNKSAHSKGSRSPLDIKRSKYRTRDYDSIEREEKKKISVPLLRLNSSRRRPSRSPSPLYERAQTQRESRKPQTKFDYRASHYGNFTDRDYGKVEEDQEDYIKLEAIERQSPTCPPIFKSSRYS